MYAHALINRDCSAISQTLTVQHPFSTHTVHDKMHGDLSQEPLAERDSTLHSSAERGMARTRASRLLLRSAALASCHKARARSSGSIVVMRGFSEAMSMSLCETGTLQPWR